MPGAGSSQGRAPALGEAGAHALARHVRAGRAAVADAYDGFAGRGPARRAPDFKTVALGLAAPPEAFAAAFRAAERAGFLDALLTRLSERGLIDLAAALADPAAPGGAVEGLARHLLPQGASGRTILPQGWTPAMAQWVGMADLLTGLSLATRRVCLLRIDGGAVQGTGFLIGPQTVLTNWHVVQSLIDPADGSARPDSARAIRCDFDALDGSAGQQHAAVEDWLVDFSPLAAPGPGHPDMTALRPHALDFCAIRLAGAPGRSRGWYDLARPGGLDDTANLTFVIQHPAANPQRVGVAQGARAEPGQPAFLLHQARTAEGSSGGLCLDHRLRPVGLHHAEVRDAGHAFLHNRAVFLRAVHAANAGLGAPDPRHDRLWRLPGGAGRAVLGRARTQARLREMMRPGAAPILFVRGGRRSGKSFSTELIRACSEADRRLIVGLSAAEIPAGARDLAALLLTRAGAPPDAIGALPGPGATHGTAEAWIRAVLLPALRQGLEDIARADPTDPRILWLVIDDLDRADIPRTDSRMLLDALYEAAAGMGILRVVLIGLPGLASVDPAQATHDTLDAPDDIAREDIETMIASLLTERAVAAQSGEIARQADLALAMADELRAQMPDEPRLPRLSEVLSSVFLRAAERWQ